MLKTDSSSLSLGAGWCLLDVKGLVHYAENSLSFEKLAETFSREKPKGVEDVGVWGEERSWLR